MKDKIEEALEKNKKQDQQLLQQSRLAQMGEMISMIAHQWRQPLGAISSCVADLEIKIDLHSYDLDTKEGQEKQSKYFLDRFTNINSFVKNLTQTIDDFRDFYKPNKKLYETTFQQLIEKALGIINVSFINYNIVVVQNYDSQDVIEMYDREMMQVILNILKNAQDNFREKELKNCQITIQTKERSLSISDNGGGIDEDILEKIFDPYFSTKTEKNGTGLGLYMSKIIVEQHHNGTLQVNNIDNGVCFTIDLNN